MLKNVHVHHRIQLRATISKISFQTLSSPLRRWLLVSGRRQQFVGCRHRESENERENRLIGELFSYLQKGFCGYFFHPQHFPAPSARAFHSLTRIMMHILQTKATTNEVKLGCMCERVSRRWKSTKSSSCLNKPPSPLCSPSRSLSNPMNRDFPF